MWNNPLKQKKGRKLTSQNIRFDLESVKNDWKYFVIFDQSFECQIVAEFSLGDIWDNFQDLIVMKIYWFSIHWRFTIEGTSWLEDALNFHFSEKV